MKTKRFRIVLVILVVAVVGGVGWLVLPPREPIYKGEKYSKWLDEYIDSDGHLSEAEEAIRHIGTNEIPRLLKMLAAKDSRFKKFAIDLAGGQSWISIRLPEAGRAQERANWAFKALGPDAKPAVPGLIAMLDGNESDVRLSALGALCSIGPSASNAVPSIIQQINGKDRRTRILAIWALGGIHSMPESAVPTLTAALQDPNPTIMLCAIDGLGAFGADAKPAVPALVELLKASDSETRHAATKALRKIDPEAAAKAGVK